MTFEPVQPGDPLSAVDENAQREVLNDLVSRIGQPVQPRQGFSNNRRYGIIRSSTATGIQDNDSNDIQWTYTLQEVYKAKVGYGDGSVEDVWKTWDSTIDKWEETSGTAYNFAEIRNSTSGVQGNGIDIDNASYDDTLFQFVACPDNTIVEFIEVIVQDSNNTITREAWFYWHTPVDGECS